MPASDRQKDGYAKRLILSAVVTVAAVLVVMAVLAIGVEAMTGVGNERYRPSSQESSR